MSAKSFAKLLIVVIVIVSIAVIYSSPAVAASPLTVNGYDGVIELSDAHGNTMTVNASCARVIAEAGLTDLADVPRSGITATPEYVNNCF